MPSDSSFQPTDLNTAQCHGILHGQGVLVTNPQDIWALVSLGSYGKGIFSRSVPCHHHIPSLGEIKQVSRKRRASPEGGAGSDEMEMSCKKRVKLHFHQKKVEDVTQSEEIECVEGMRIKELEDQAFVGRLKAIKKDDPYFMDEYLQLGAEEAFYLATEVKVLSIVKTKAAVLTDGELWVHFSQLCSLFYARYAAYAHYRAGNWVPKSGLKFGVDFLLYKEGPLSYHSSFAIVIKVEEEGGNGSKHGSKGSGLTWKEVIAQDRVSESAGKDLLICHVIKPQGMTEERLREPCIHLMRVKNVLVKRWVPEKDRETKIFSPQVEHKMIHKTD